MRGLPADPTDLVLDGGLATQLEAMGADLQGALWSGRLLHEEPSLVQQAHAAFLAAGADACITASYQCSVPTLKQVLGIGDAEAEALIVRSVTLARAACSAASAATPARRPPLVAASVGPYGACLNDGSEYTGAYGVGPGAMSADALAAWHRRRFELLVASGADVLAMETMPCKVEVLALCALLKTAPAARCWISLACGSDDALNSGEPLADVVRAIAAADATPPFQVQAIGINCTAPRHVASLLRIVRELAGARKVVVYPNSGERWESTTCSWCDDPDGLDFVACCLEWCGAPGGQLVGGCCRVGPAQIGELRRALDRRPAVAGP